MPYVTTSCLYEFFFISFFFLPLHTIFPAFDTFFIYLHTHTLTNTQDFTWRCTKRNQNQKNTNFQRTRLFFSLSRDDKLTEKYNNNAFFMNLTQKWKILCLPTKCVFTERFHDFTYFWHWYTIPLLSHDITKKNILSTFIHDQKFLSTFFSWKKKEWFFFTSKYIKLHFWCDVLYLFIFFFLNEGKFKKL